MKPFIINLISNILESYCLEDSNKLLQIKELIQSETLDKKSQYAAKSLKLLFDEKFSEINEDEMVKNVIASGFKSFDDSFGGFRKGEIVIIGSRPGMGKSQFLINLALNMLNSGKSVLFHSLVLSDSQMASRFLASLTTIPYFKVLLNDLTKIEKDILVQESKNYEHLKMILTAERSFTLDWIAYYQNQILENNLEVIFIDDINIHFENKTKKEILIFTTSLVKLAEMYNVCIIASTQIHKKMESRGGELKPRLSDFMINDNLEQSAGKIIGLYRAEHYGITTDENGDSLKNIADLILLKNKNGNTGVISIKKDENFTNFKDLISNKREKQLFYDIKEIIKKNNPSENPLSLGFLEAQIQKLNINCKLEELLNEIGLMVPIELNNRSNQANAIQYFIQTMDIEMVDTFLDEKSKFERLSKNEFLKRLDKVFRKMKSFGDTFLYASEGKCNKCDTSKKGFQFIGNSSGFYINILFIIDNEKVISIEECSNMFAHTRNIRLKDRILIDGEL